jgi:hypothetical protein
MPGRHAQVDRVDPPCADVPGMKSNERAASDHHRMDVRRMQRGDGLRRGVELRLVGVPGAPVDASQHSQRRIFRNDLPQVAEQLGQESERIAGQVIDTAMFRAELAPRIDGPRVVQQGGAQQPALVPVQRRAVSLTVVRARYSLARSMGSVLCVDRKHVVHETIDGETILIHLRSGTYYSLAGTGSEAWELLAAGATRETLLAFGRERYLGDPVEIELGLSGLLDHLLQQGLLVERDELPAVERPGLPTGQVAFAVPMLEAYTDMQEFMLVDPLHEVDKVAGWPRATAD